MPATKAKRQRLHTRSIISLPVPVEDGKRIVKAARASGLPVATFCREAAVERANRVLARLEKDAQAAAASAA